MKKTYPLAGFPNVLDILRKAGYAYFKDPLSGEESFVVRLTAGFYPRFHLYVENDGTSIVFNLHLDQKQPSYGEGTKHSGEYDGPVVENEMRRIESWIKSAFKHLNDDTSEHTRDTDQSKRQGKATKSWWRRVLGLGQKPKRDTRVER